MSRSPAALLAACLAFAGHALAQAEPPVVELAGTLAKARTSGVVTLAHRESSIPFSYLSARGEPIGYSVELCRKVVEAMSTALGRELAIRWLPVTSESRLEAIVTGQADLECGSTTSNLERARRVGFSPTIFVSGTKLMVRRGSAIRSFRDLRGKAVAVTAGTTNEKAMTDLKAKFGIDFRLIASRDHAESFALVVAGKADAFATDDVLLYGLIAANGKQRELQVVGEFLSYDPYALVYRRGDPQMKQLVEDTFRFLAEDGEVERQYQQWFIKRLPSGPALGLPMSPQLEELVRAMGTKPE